jgi:hypothetical protein
VSDGCEQAVVEALNVDLKNAVNIKSVSPTSNFYFGVNHL